MNQHPEEMAELIATHVVPHITPSSSSSPSAAEAALLALTLKFPGKPSPERLASAVGRVVGILGAGGLTVAAQHCVWLHANSANERTLLVAGAGAGGGQGGGGE